MSYSLNSSKGGCIGDYIGDSYMGLLRGIVGVYTIKRAMFLRILLNSLMGSRPSLSEGSALAILNRHVSMGPAGTEVRSTGC